MRDIVGNFIYQCKSKVHLPAFESFKRKSTKVNNFVVILYDHHLQILNGAGCVLPEYPYDTETLLRVIPPSLQKICPSSGQKCNICLILPPIFFQYTHFELPGIDEGNLRNALNLQASYILAASGEELLAEMDFGYSGESGNALWMKKDFVNELYDILMQRGLILEKIIPRPLSLLFGQKRDYYCVEDIDNYQSTCVAVSGRTIVNWVSICGNDRKNKDFLNEYTVEKEKIISSVGEHSGTPCSVIQDDCLHWHDADQGKVFFVPPGYVTFRSQRLRKKIRNILIIVACIVSCLLSVPIIRLSLQANSTQEKILELKVRNAELIRLSAEISEFNEQWGIITQFPTIDVANLLLNLNKLIPKDSWLSSLSLDNGMLEITGYSPNPDNILSILSKQDYFVDVSYSQVVRIEHEKGEYNYFGIQCKLKDIDILAYLEKFFQNEYEY